MAGREGQGLQIAVIIFAMLTIVLAITTFIFYSQAQTAAKDMESAKTAQAQAQKQADTMTYRALAAQYVLGMGGVTEEQVNLAKNKAGGADADGDAMITNFKADMSSLGAQAGEAGALNYRTLPQFLLGSISKKNTSVADANLQTRTATATAQTEVTANAARADASEKARDAAVAELKTEADRYAADRTAIQADKDKLAVQVTAISTKSKADADKLTKERDAYLAQASKQQGTIENQKVRIEELQKSQVDLFENPDGKITWVNQRQGLVWLNLGSADGLLRQTNFSVYDHDENGVANAEAKARLEVVRVVDNHLAEAKILEDKPSNPILPGDIVHTPSWSPGQRIHFALAGFMDIDNDRVNDFELIKNVIQVNGGIVDAELLPDGTRKGKLTVNTRYLVVGDAPADAASETAFQQFTKIHQEAKDNGADTIDVQDLLAMMGWKPEERTVEMRGSGGGGEFRKRQPGKKMPPAAKGATPAPAAEGAPAAEPAAPAADPFGTPAPAAAPADADPFGAAPAADAAPAPAPAPAAGAAEADPFADPK